MARWVMVLVWVLALSCVMVGGGAGEFVLAAGGLALGFFLAGAAWASLYGSRAGRRAALRVEVGPSHDGGQLVPHVIAARLRDRAGEVVHYERVDLREEGYEERLAVAVAEMKHKVRVIEAARQIGREP